MPNKVSNVFRRIFILLFGLSLLFAATLSYAIPFIIVPKAGTTLPTEIFGVGTAYYTVTNNTVSARNNNFVKYLPPNVAQVTTGGTYGDTCGATFNLTGRGQAGSSCTLQLTITGSVDGNDPDPHHHLFVCFPEGITCAGTGSPLNVTAFHNLLSIAVTPATATIRPGGTQQYTATGTFSDGTTHNISSLVTWHSSDTTVATISATGLATGVAPGTTNITATFVSVTSNAAVLHVNSFLYVVNSTVTFNISYCSVNNDGTIGGCLQNSGGVARPREIAIDPTATHAYISDNTNSIVDVCNIDISTGNITGCVQATTFAFASPQQIAINPTNTFAYIIDNNGVIRCAIDSTTGLLSSCSVTGALPANLAGIAINPAGTFAYITSGTGLLSNVSFCQISSSNGGLFNCHFTSGPTGVSSPGEIAFNPAGTVIFWVNIGNNTVDYCTFGVAGGDFDSCHQPAAGDFTAPKGITVSSSAFYVTDSTNVKICVINILGTFTCSTSDNVFNGAYGIAIK